MSCRKTSFNIAASSSISEYSEYCNYYFNFVVWLLRIESLLFFLRATVSFSPGKRESDVSKSLTCKTPSSRSLKVKEGARVCGPWFVAQCGGVTL